MEFNFLEGEVLLIDKPISWTSFDVVNKLRFAIKKKLGIKKIKVGHAGTLDPLATGLLIICTGKFTKKIESYQAQYKSYEGKLILGQSTPSYDAETEVDKNYNIEHISNQMIIDNTANFLGKIMQIPPVFSAIKVNGQPMYKKARKGEKIKIKSREVTIHKFDITDINTPEITFYVECSKGTYIRSLAHDFGQILESGAYLSALKRTGIGDYKLKDAWNLDELINTISD